MILHSNTIKNASQFGIVVEDGLRNLPEYTFYDPADVIDHAQFTSGDYIPSSGPVRKLREINEQMLVPGVTITNNVLAFNAEGGIHFAGDPNGYVFVAPVGAAPGEIQDGYTFDIVDHNGFTQRFRFVNGVPTRFVGPGIIDVNWTATPADPYPCLNVHGLGDCSNRYHPTQRDMADSLIHAIDSSSLDVTVMRGKGDELFIEGAAAIIGVNPLGWTSIYVQEVQPGAVPYGRIVNNTLVGLGGNLPSDNLYNQKEFTDAGILIEDNADPTVMNNIIVNFKEGVAADLTSGTATIGGTLFQGNVRNARNTDIGDFPLILGPDDPLFVDRERGNFYPADLSRAIDRRWIRSRIVRRR